MDADHRENIRKFLRQLDRAPAALHRCSDRDDAVDAGICRASQNIIEIRSEIRIIEMGVGLYEHREEVTSGIVNRYIGPILDSRITSQLHHSTTVLAHVNPPPKTTINT